MRAKRSPRAPEKTETSQATIADQAGAMCSRSNETELSHRYRCKTIRRECVSAKTRIALGQPGARMQSEWERG